jgi:uncharacterized repeat protein (TIGR03803 family)
MKSSGLGRYALSRCVAAALLAGCGGSQPLTVPAGSAQEYLDARGPATATSAYNVLYNFKGGKDGKSPSGNLINVDGTFYGTTELGGNTICYGLAYGCGVVFSTTSGGEERVLYRFKPPGGFYPAGIIHVGTSLYGLTSGGGSGHCGAGSQGGCGTLFELTASGKERTLYNFKGLSDGQQPLAAPIYVGGKFYGTTFGGGAHSYGIVFEIDLSGKERVLHTFSGTGSGDGASPQDGLIDIDDTLYGTTAAGGKKNAQACYQSFGNSCGTVFSVTRSGKYRVLYRFKGQRDGAYPVAGVTYLNGELYGTTFFGGEVGSGCPAGCGTVFEVNPSSGREHVVYSFKGGADGYLSASVLLPYHGQLYGTTPYGGTGNKGPCSISGYGHCGTIYRISPTGTKSILYDFQGPPTDGNRPSSQRLLEVSGALYGTTGLGGSHCRPELGCGTIFQLTP